MSSSPRSADIEAEADRLWEFAVSVYRQEPVKQACLSIQARYGLSISLLLGVIWAGAQGYGRLGATELETSVRRGLEWHREVIEPMRALRRRLRQGPPPGLERRTEALRQGVLAQELEAERIQQRLLLEDFVAGQQPGAELWRDAARNAALLTRKSCPRPDPEALEALGTILREVFPDIDAQSLAGECGAGWAG